MLMLLLTATVSGEARGTRFVVDAGPCARLCEPVTVTAHRLPQKVRLREADSGREVPVQVTRDGATAHVTWIVRDLPAGEPRAYDLGAGSPAAAEGVRLVRSDGAVAITVGGRPFTTYHFAAGLPRPYCFPVLGPRGERVTRAYPMEKVPGETTDHEHHRSFWFAFGSANRVDCWSEAPTAGRTVHRALGTLEDGPVYGRLRTANDWVGPDGKKLMEDERDLCVYDVGPALRLLDFAITLKATEGPVKLGDTKEGMFGFRVASTMDVRPDGTGGRIENSEGGVNEAATWGKRANWCDYSGPVAGGTSGIAMFDHPANLRHPTYWMVRDYGLFACNPFGVREYTGDPQADGSYVIPAGESLTLRYRIAIHEGNAAAANVKGLWESYAAPVAVRAG